MQKMWAVQLNAPGKIEYVEVEKPKLENDDHVILKVKACGICGSDLNRVMSKASYENPLIIGHEFSGIVDDLCENNYNFNKGDRVTVIPLIPCGECDYCRIGQYVLCDNYSYYGSREDGALAEYVKVKSKNVIKIPNNMDFESAAMTDPTTVALHAIKKSKIGPGQTAAVFGLGAIGLLAIQWLKYLGCSVIYAIDILDEKLKLAEVLGADICINSIKQNVNEIIVDSTNNKGLDIALEFAGSKIAQIQCIASVKKMGRVILCGISYEDLTIPSTLLSNILRHEIELIGAWNSLNSPLPVSEWDTSLKFINSGKIKCRSIISHKFKLEQCAEAFDMMLKKKEVFNKVIFKPEN